MVKINKSFCVAGIMTTLVMSVNSMFGIEQADITKFFDQLCVLSEKIDKFDPLQKNVLTKHGVKFKEASGDIRYRYLLLMLKIKPECISKLETRDLLRISDAVINKEINDEVKKLFSTLEYVENSDKIPESDINTDVPSKIKSMVPVSEESKKSEEIEVLEDPTKIFKTEISNSQDVETVKRMIVEPHLEELYLSGNIEYKDFEQFVELVIQNSTIKTFSVESKSFNYGWIDCIITKLGEYLKPHSEDVAEKHFYLGGRNLERGAWHTGWKALERLLENFSSDDKKFQATLSEKITLDKIENSTTIPASVKGSHVVVPAEPEPILGRLSTPEEVISHYVELCFSPTYTCRGNALAYKNIFDQTILLVNGTPSNSVGRIDSILVSYDDIVCLVCNKGSKYCLSPSEDLIQKKPIAVPESVIDETKKRQYRRCCKYNNGDFKEPKAKDDVERAYMHTEIQIQGLLGRLNKELQNREGRDEDLVKTIICLLPKLLVVQQDVQINSKTINAKILEARESYRAIRTISQEQEQEVLVPMSERSVEWEIHHHHSHHHHSHHHHSHHHHSHHHHSHHHSSPVRRRSDFGIEFSPKKRNRISETLSLKDRTVSVNPELKVRTIFANPEQASSFCIFSLFEACWWCRETKWLKNKGSDIENKLFFKVAILDNQATKDGRYIRNNRVGETVVFVDQWAIENRHIFLNKNYQWEE